jgi:hypothetical protein
MGTGCGTPTIKNDLLSVKVKKYDDDVPEDWLGDMRKSQGYTEDVIIEHMRKNFNTEQFKDYKFYLYGKYDRKSRWVNLKEIIMK